jgi:aerobic carbon-monoxide dehydrogenase medium subunit
MIPPEFEYAAPSSLEEVISLLSQRAGDDAKLIAGGHSLLPLMKLGFAQPGLLVDLRNVPGLSGVQSANGSGPRIGALTRHVELQQGDYGLITEAAKQIADQQVRNRGTIGGSVAHGDPASDLPTVVLTMDGTINVQGPNGERSIPAAEMWQDYLTTAVADDEVVTSIDIPSYEGYGHAYLKFTRRAEDWAMVGVAALVKVDGGTITDARVGMTHMGQTPLRARAVERELTGKPAQADVVAAAAEYAAEGTNPPTDLNATTEYKQHLAKVMVRRAVEQAAGL